MKPITRKELYLNKIVGNNDFETPEKPISEEEFFFVEILGEAAQAPEPLTRYQIYLAKIAGKNVEIPYPETRLEYFLARAAGMNVETPTPITREEVFWSNYSAIVDFEVEGVPPLTYKAIEGTLENYRIYGNTVGGESVGDLVTSGEHAGEYKVPVTVEGKNLFDENNANIIKGYFNSQTFNITSSSINRTIYIPCLPNTTYTLTKSVQKTTSTNRFRACTTTEIPTNNVVINDYVAYSDGTTETNLSITTGANARYLCCFIYSIDTEMAFEKFLETIQIEKNFSATPYEPYHAPVTTPIYLPEQIKKVGDEAEYIDYGKQKFHRISGADLDVTLPALPTIAGTNTMSVGTEVQPSKVYIKGEKERD